MRHPQSVRRTFDRVQGEASVINAGDGMNEHPTQALLICSPCAPGKAIWPPASCLVGDVMHSGSPAATFGRCSRWVAAVRLAAPGTLLAARLDRLGATICPTVADAVRNADVVMGLRIQLERMQKALFPSVSEYAAFNALDETSCAWPEKTRSSCIRARATTASRCRHSL
jgi:aspartate carbamoyltransferase catalytic subunit